MSVLSEVAAEVRVCTLCELSVSRTNAVPGTGPETAEVFFIGEGPGWHEDQQGLPFVGASGKFLTELIETAGLRREDVFITNVVKCRPPGNRDPLPDEMEACAPYLNRQIETVDPLVVVTLGRFSMSRYFPSERISRIHGQPRVIGRRTVVPMYHPAAALHQGSLRGAIVEDFVQLGKIIAKARAERERGDQPTPEATPAHEQMKLF
ncbi:MAG: uracil-DNA glycosylase [Thermomicrobiales bacterium]|nr:uracil-DNA glycosylase [Thermomicrobiales bacterium]MCO5221316.1 uracil-DNA glycosylase [Thermomicrobiales bacterium]